MTVRRELRLLFLGATQVAIVAMIAVSAFILWPIWQEHRAIQNLIAVLPLDQEPDPLEERVKIVQEFAGGRAAIPELIEELKKEDEHVSWRARYALLQLRPLATDPLIKILADDMEDSRAKIAAAWALGPMRDSIALPALVDALRDSDARVRGQAAWALRFHAPDSKVAVPLLQGLLRDENQKVRRSAVFALAGLGPDAKPALTELIELLKDTDPDTVIFALTTLEKIGPEAKDAVPSLIELLDYGWLHDEAVETLIKIDPVAAKALGYEPKDDSGP